jgi:hypothetical protein
MEYETVTLQGGPANGQTVMIPKGAGEVVMPGKPLGNKAIGPDDVIYDSAEDEAGVYEFVRYRRVGETDIFEFVNA